MKKPKGGKPGLKEQRAATAVSLQRTASCQACFHAWAACSSSKSRHAGPRAPEEAAVQGPRPQQPAQRHAPGRRADHAGRHGLVGAGPLQAETAAASLVHAADWPLLHTTGRRCTRPSSRTMEPRQARTGPPRQQMQRQTRCVAATWAALQAPPMPAASWTPPPPRRSSRGLRLLRRALQAPAAVVQAAGRLGGGQRSLRCASWTWAAALAGCWCGCLRCSRTRSCSAWSCATRHAPQPHVLQCTFTKAVHL